MSHRQREREKAQLLRRIQQQRLDITAERKRWLAATEGYDRAWHTLTRWRRYWLVGCSAAALYGIRHPSRLVRWARRAIGLLGTYRLLRKTLSQR